MRQSIIIAPAYGRDYNSAAEAKQDFYAGKDFIIESIGNPYCGKYCSIRDLKGYEVEIRFRHNTKFTLVQA